MREKKNGLHYDCKPCVPRLQNYCVKYVGRPTGFEVVIGDALGWLHDIRTGGIGYDSIGLRGRGREYGRKVET